MVETRVRQRVHMGHNQTGGINNYTQVSNSRFNILSKRVKNRHHISSIIIWGTDYYNSFVSIELLKILSQTDFQKLYS